MIPLFHTKSQFNYSIHSKSLPFYHAMFNSTFLPPPEPGISIHHDTVIPSTYTSDYLLDKYFTDHLGSQELSHYLDIPDHGQLLINNVHEDSNSSLTACVHPTLFTQEMTSTTGSSASCMDGMPINSYMEEDQLVHKVLYSFFQIHKIRKKSDSYCRFPNTYW